MADTVDVATGVAAMVLVVLLVILLLGFPLMWLWNGLMPDLFNLPTITFWQAVGLNILSAILFKNPISYNKNS
jgi:uncharacterized membrane protein